MIINHHAHHDDIHVRAWEVALIPIRSVSLSPAFGILTALIVILIFVIIIILS